MKRRLLSTILMTLSLGFAFAATGCSERDDRPFSMQECVKTLEHPEPPAFHADWTPEERAALLHLYKTVIEESPAVFAEIADKTNKACISSGFVNAPFTRADFEAFAKEYAFMQKAVAAIISGGAQTLHSEWEWKEGDETAIIRPLWLSVYYGAFDAMEMMLRRGADPKMCWIRTDSSGERKTEPLLATMLAFGARTGGHASLSMEERLAVATRLLEAGADFSNPEADWATYLRVGCIIADEKDRDTLLGWALDHGMSPEHVVYSVTGLDGTLAIFRRLVQDGLIDLRHESLRLQDITGGYAEDVEKVRILLEAGVPVDGFPPVRREGEDDEDWQERQEYWETPVQCVQRGLRFTGPEELKDEYGRVRWERGLQLLELYVSYGAEADEFAEDLPEDPELAAQVTAAISRGRASRPADAQETDK